MLPKDKVYHFAVCALLTLIHPCLAIGAAIGKEYGDKGAPGNHWCWWDLLADAVGVIVGVTIQWLIKTIL